MEPAPLVMMRRMLLSVKQRAEARWKKNRHVRKTNGKRENSQGRGTLLAGGDIRETLRLAAAPAATIVFKCRGGSTTDGM